MALEDLRKRVSIGGGEAELIPGCDPGRDGWMVQSKHRQSIRRACELSIEPTQPTRVQFAPILSWSCAVQHHEPQRPEIHRVLHRRAHCSGQVEMPPERFTVVMVSGQDVDRHAELREQLAHKLILSVGGVVGQVA